MLSILIPTYNYNILPLVKELQAQCMAAGITYEIISADDGSGSALNAENEKINSLQHCRFTAFTQNRGRSAMRNRLADEAKYNWLLFLDADTLPVDGLLIQRYLPYIDEKEKVVYGSIRYQPQKPDKDKLLRWVYGNNREALPANERQKLPYLRLLTLNFLIHKNVFGKVRFNETMPNLRHEDTLFSYNLMKADIPVEHIENNVYHLGLDDSYGFIKKTEEAQIGLKYLLDKQLLPAEYINMGKMYKKLKRTGLSAIAGILFKVSKRVMIKNLAGGNPSLRIFDLYRIGYICSLKQP
jgi:glycosyltransferase involved in cell wall biosynthesis